MDQVQPSIGRPSGRSLAVAGAVLALVVILFVLPAQFRIDPTGFGAATGLDQISSPKTIALEGLATINSPAARAYPAPFRTDTVEVPLGGSLDPFLMGLEYKVTLKKGDILMYSWSAPENVFVQFHGHSAEPGPDGRTVVVNYSQETLSRRSGVLVAPMDGIHGWFFRRTRREPTVVTVHLSGFYTLEPGIIDFLRK
jgi:hypothetical protein